VICISLELFPTHTQSMSLFLELMDLVTPSTPSFGKQYDHELDLLVSLGNLSHTAARTLPSYNKVAFDQWNKSVMCDDTVRASTSVLLAIWRASCIKITQRTFRVYTWWRWKH